MADDGHFHQHHGAEGHSGCGCSTHGTDGHAPPPPTEEEARSLLQQSNLYPYIDLSRVTALNDGGAASRVLVPYHQRRPGETYLCRSVADQQLIIVVPFSVTVKITHIGVTGPAAEEARWPATMRAYVNRDDVDFATVEQMACTQSWELAGPHRPEVEPLYATRPAKFQNVQRVTLFFPGNLSGDDGSTAIEHIGFYGKATGYRRAPVAAVYEARPLATDSRSRVEVNHASQYGL
jgi:hypothetical protein